jgi:hypothetical protein
MSLKSIFSAPGTFPGTQVFPPSVVLRKVPCVPLAQATRLSTADTPRRPAVVLLVWMDQLSSFPWGAFFTATRKNAANKTHDADFLIRDSSN